MPAGDREHKVKALPDSVQPSRMLHTAHHTSSHGPTSLKVILQFRAQGDAVNMLRRPAPPVWHKLSDQKGLLVNCLSVYVGSKVPLDSRLC